MESKAIDEMTVTEIRQELKRQDLAHVGPKTEIIKRLQAHREKQKALTLKDPSAPAVPAKAERAPPKRVPLQPRKDNVLGQLPGKPVAAKKDAYGGEPKQAPRPAAAAESAGAEPE